MKSAAIWLFVLGSVLLATSTATAQNVSRQLTITPSSVNFDTVTVGTSASITLTIANVGNKSTSLRLPPSISGNGFSCSGLPASLGPGRSSSFSVTFTPASLGTVNGSISVGGTGANKPATVSLSGTGGGYPQLTSNPTSLSFGKVTVGTISTLPVIITNSGTTSATISQYSATGTGFTVAGLKLPLSLAAGQSTSFNVTFAPTTTTSASGSASFASNASNSPNRIPLAGSGVAAVGQLTTNPTSLSFGTVTVGTSSTLPVAFSNTGTGSATISQANVTGSGFTVTGLTLPLTLSPGQGAFFDVAFTPGAAGTISGSVSLVSNASNSPASVPLSATGGNRHYVNLSWTDTSSPAGYNVFRSTKSGGPYAQINGSLDPSTTYTDNSVFAGQTYYYVTTAVSSSGVQSGYSNQVQVVVPSP